MVDFNQNVKDVTSNSDNLLSSSKGIPSPDAHAYVGQAADGSASSSGLYSVAGVVVNDLAKIGVAGVDAADTLIKEDIDDRAHTQADQVFNEYGVDDALTIKGSDIGAEPPPAEIDRAAKNAERLTSAVKRGTLDENAYWTRMESISRQLRARYPGHRDYIDQKISSIAGGKPANQIVNNIFQAAEKLKTNVDAQERRRQEVFEKVGFKHYLPGMENWSIDQLYRYGGPLLSQDEQINLSNARATLDKNDREAVDSASQKGATVIANQELYKVIYNVTSPLGENLKTLEDNLNKNFSEGHTPTAQQSTALAAQVNSLKQNVRQQVTARLLKEVPTLTADQQKQALGQVNQFLETIDDAVTNPKSGGLARLAYLKQAIQDGDDINLAATYPLLRKQGAVRRTIGDMNSQLLAQNAPELQSATAKLLFSEQLDDTFSDIPGSSLKGSMRKASELGVSDPKYATKMIEAGVAHVSDPRANAAEVKAGARALYSPENQGFLGLIRPNSQGKTFIALANPAVMSRIERDAPEHLENYKSWVKDSFTVVARSTLDDLKQAGMLDGTGKVRLTFDEKTNTFTPQGFDESQGVLNVSTGRDLVKTLNQYMQAVAPIIQKDGGSPLQYMKRLGFSPTNVINGGTGKTNLGGGEGGDRLSPFNKVGTDYNASADPIAALLNDQQLRSSLQVSPEVGDNKQMQELSDLTVQRYKEFLNIRAQSARDWKKPGQKERYDNALDSYNKANQELHSIQQQWFEQLKSNIDSTEGNIDGQ